MAARKKADAAVCVVDGAQPIGERPEPALDQVWDFIDMKDKPRTIAITGFTNTPWGHRIAVGRDPMGKRITCLLSRLRDPKLATYVRTNTRIV